ncbi:MAG: Arc family DNA binding domain-containing protein [Acidobacteria bacterium]|nr:Arc family DNA binding domain-containing protein [Acidobacteriota bacterium]
MASRKSVLVRMSPELWSALNRWASEEFRSLNGQIEFLLHKAVQEKKRENRDQK